MIVFFTTITLIAIGKRVLELGVPCLGCRAEAQKVFCQKEVIARVTGKRDRFERGIYG